MYKYIKTVLFFFIVFLLSSCGRVKIFVTSLPENTPENSDIYITGNFNYWDPGDQRYRLKKVSDSIYMIQLPSVLGKISYKFTRGDWTTVEGDPCGYDLENRDLNSLRNDSVINSIESWKDLGPTNCPKLTIVVNHFPENTPEEDQLYLVGNLNNWDMDDRDFPLTEINDSTYAISINKFAESLEFKLTRGSFSSVEVDNYGTPIDVRTIEFGKRDTVYVSIQAWDDMVQKDLQQITFIIEDLPENTPQYDDIYLVGNFNNWYPWDKDFIFSRSLNGMPSLTISVDKPVLKYKITRGGWKTREVDENFEDITDRTHIYQYNDTVYLSIENWSDLQHRQAGKSKFLTIIIEGLPKETPKGADIFISGSFNSWRYNDPDYILQKHDDGSLYYRLPKSLGEIEYKFSRGSEETIEVNKKGRKVAYRKSKNANVDTVYTSITYWLDLLPVKLSQVRFTIKRLPSNTPENADIYIAGNFNGWDPGNERFKLKSNEEGLLEIVIPRKFGREYYNAFEYKFTRGNWKTVETTSSGADISNRSYIFGDKNEVEILIEGWHDNPTLN